ncbi:MAG: TrkH family potassium uptake protein [Anaerolineales bacterium]|nr:MAG: TrkH family potassium uptake protein [Anaerolineales bacterium]
MNIRAVSHLISYLLGLITLAMGISLVVSFAAGDPTSAKYGLAGGCAISLAAAILIWLLTRGPIELSRRDGFGVATFGWLSAAVFGALPYIISGTISHPIPAVFETMSGFTTTGASVLTDLESLPRGIIFWRAMTHFLGGMGVLVLCAAILPFLKVGGMQVYRAEVPGPSKDRLTPRIASTAKLLWGAYLLFCVLETVLLRFGGMSWFDAWCHTCATMATGGFSTRTASVGAYDSLYLETIIICFMFIAGTNFVLHLKLLKGRPFAYFRDPEFRIYLLFWLSACLILTLNVWGDTYESFGESLRAAFFQGTSILTTTGLCTADFDAWPETSRILLVLLMFVGGCAGSTGGGVKNIRVLVVVKALFREIFLYMRPSAVKKVKVGGATVKQESVSNIVAFLMIFVILFAAGSLIMTAFTPDLGTAVSCTIACLGNIGPGLNAVGATQNYAEIPSTGKAILVFFMLLGRLELYTVLVIFSPGFWKK